MKFIKNPLKDTWDSLCKRPESDFCELEATVASVFKAIQERGDQALIDFTKKFDHVEIDQIEVYPNSMEFSIDAKLQESIRLAKRNIEIFHLSQKEPLHRVKTLEGVTCWRKSVAVQNVGLYIPGGSAPLFSTLLMLVVPAKIAGCENIVVCTPPSKSGGINEVIGWTCQLLGIEKVYLAGGAQAIAAMAFGTPTLPKSDKLFGPGNQYVMAAKQM
ncbi:MAG: histidinol dehydrogenase, partial [Ekhidna sp.]|nr:histidinol dehydrogenase [Ekhidna sp.]